MILTLLIDVPCIIENFCRFMGVIQRFLKYSHKLRTTLLDFKNSQEYISWFATDESTQ